MSDQFKVGEIAILQNATYFHEYNDYPCIILSKLTSRKTLDLNTMEIEEINAYSVEVGVKGNVVSVQPFQLRKLRNETKAGAICKSYFWVC